MLTTKKTSTGEFDVFWNGEKTDWRIFNGSHGFCGNGAQNTYGISKGSWFQKIGSLATCKKLIADRLAGKL